MPSQLSKPQLTAAGISTSGKRFLFLGVLAIPIAALAALLANLLLLLIAGITQFLFFGIFSTEWVAPTTEHRGAWVILIPALGGGIIALMARFGSKAIIGHGIPEVMQQILTNRSRISSKVALLKPLSSAISIGTGAPYGAEGPVIATGSAIGSLIGQVFTVTATERKILLSAGAAAGMTAVFGCPVAATLLSVELLLFELNAKSVVPVAIAAAVAQAIRIAISGQAALFAVSTADLQAAPMLSGIVFALIGICAGLLAVAANASVHRTEKLFERLPVNWMWHPVIGGLAVGLLGWIDPRVFGAGYGVIESLLLGSYPLGIIAAVCTLKLLSWIISLGSGTSGGTLAPMLIIGGGLGALVGAGCNFVANTEIPLGLAALAGMTAFFAGGSRAIFASIVLAVEITQDAMVLWPVSIAAATALGAAYLSSRSSIMSSPVEQRGFRVPMSFDADVFSRFEVAQVMEPVPHLISPEMTIGELADRIGAHDPRYCQHTALLVANDEQQLLGIITRSDLMASLKGELTTTPVAAVMTKEVVCAFPAESLHLAIERMNQHDVGRLPVIEGDGSRKLTGYLGRAAILSVRKQHWIEQNRMERGWF